jgi:hypothetical protein
VAREDDHNTTVASCQAHPAPSYWRLAHVLIHRWPTALGVMVAALTAFDLNLNAEFVAFLEIARNGCKKVVLLNAHGGNSSSDAVCKTEGRTLNLLIFSRFPSYAFYHIQ